MRPNAKKELKLKSSGNGKNRAFKKEKKVKLYRLSQDNGENTLMDWYGPDLRDSRKKIKEREMQDISLHHITDVWG